MKKPDRAMQIGLLIGAGSGRASRHNGLGAALCRGFF